MIEEIMWWLWTLIEFGLWLSTIVFFVALYGLL